MTAIPAISCPTPFPVIPPHPKPSQIGVGFREFPLGSFASSAVKRGWVFWLIASCYLLAAKLSKTVQLPLFLTGRQIVQFTICSPRSQEENACPGTIRRCVFSQNLCSCSPAARTPCRASVSRRRCTKKRRDTRAKRPGVEVCVFLRGKRGPFRPATWMRSASTSSPKSYALESRRDVR
jgi:hypothetical protein